MKKPQSVVERTVVHNSIVYPKPSSTRRDIHRILVRQQHNDQTGVVVNKPKKGLIYDTGVANTLFMTAQNVHDTDPGSARRCHGCFDMI